MLSYVMIFCDVITPLYCALFQKQLVCGAFDVMHQYFLVIVPNLVMAFPNGVKRNRPLEKSSQGEIVPKLLGDDHSLPLDGFLKMRIDLCSLRLLGTTQLNFICKSHNIEYLKYAPYKAANDK